MISCAIFPAYNSFGLIDILEGKDYVIIDVDEEVEEGIVGYIYAARESTNDELYYIYCKDMTSAKSIYDYIDSAQKAQVAELKWR